MLFNSLQFLIFFPIVTALYFFLPHKFRWAWLLAASCYFYMAFIPAYIFILFFTIIVDYIAGRLIEKTVGKTRKLYLIISIISNLGILAFFKYYNFFAENITALAQTIHWNYSLPALAIILPIGLSFHIFQALSYTIEVYRGHQPAEKHLGIYALYVMFYPQLVAGPIERPQNLLHQFKENHPWDTTRIKGGLRLMGWGLIKKILIADSIARLINPIFTDPAQGNLPLIIAISLFAFQIYYDFSGYSDIALGAAEVMGFKLMKNFNRPYASQSISEFWRRWHISLSTWFKDYVYIPLGGSKNGRFNQYRNLFIVFLLSGLWHGAAWTFIIWGALHGLYLISADVTKNIREKIFTPLFVSIPRIHKLLKISIVFLLVTFSWIFFRASSIHEVWYIITHLFTGISTLTKSNLILVILLVIGITLIELVQYTEQDKEITKSLNIKQPWLKWLVYHGIFLAFLLAFYLGKNSPQSFIYFQF